MKNDYHGWNTPTGLGIFFICVAVAVVLLSIALLNVTRSGQIGVSIGREAMPMMQQWEQLEKLNR